MTLVAASGPLLVSVTVKVMVSPTLGVGVAHRLGQRQVGLLRRLGGAGACCWPCSGSNWSASLTVAVLVWAAGLTTRACSVSVAEAAASTVPTVHSPVVLS